MAGVAVMLRASTAPPKRDPGEPGEACPKQTKTCSKVKTVEFPKRIEKQCGQYPAILKNAYLSL